MKNFWLCYFFRDNKIILGEQQTLEMLVEVINKGEPAYLPEVTIVLPAYTPLVRYPQNCQNAQDGNKPDKHVLNCNFGNALSGNVRFCFSLYLIVLILQQFKFYRDFMIHFKVYLLLLIVLQTRL